LAGTDLNEVGRAMLAALTGFHRDLPTKGRAVSLSHERLREVAPSTELRRWFGHDPQRWGEFRRRYARELRGHRELLDQIRSLARNGRVTPLFGARDELHKDAVALRDILLK